MAAVTAGVVEREPILDALQTMLAPSIAESFRETMPAGEVSLLVFDEPEQPPRPLTLRNMFPFMTLYDVKLAIYAAIGDDKALPEFTFLGRPFPPGKKLMPVDYAWSIPAQPDAPVVLPAPFELATASQVDARFVEASGERRILGILERDRITLEDLFLDAPGKKLPTFHVYFYKDIAALVPGPRPLTERDWNGRLFPYFPRLAASKDVPTDTARTRATKFMRGFLRRRQFLTLLEQFLEAGEPLLPLTMTAVRFMRLQYRKPKGAGGVDTLFYEVPVNERRPYMRLIPTEGSPISKVHLLADSRPDLEDPRLILQWSQERSPTPERNFALAKILLRRTSGTIPPLYCTLRLLDDGTADVTVEPPRGIRKLDPRSELDTFPQGLLDGLQGLRYANEMPALTGGVFVFGLHLKGAATTPFTQRSLRAKLPLFSGTFQEIPALPGEKPLLMLRYKSISNFVNEDRIQSFITQVMNRKLVKGEGVLTDMVELVADEFQLGIDDARRKVAEKLKESGDVQLVNQETKDYMLTANTGIDIAIFAQHPFYSFHVYRVESVITLRRILAFLSILMSKPSEELQVSPEAAAEAATSPAVPLVPKAAEATGAAEEDGFEDVTEEEVAAAVVTTTLEAAENEGDGFENVKPEELEAAPVRMEEEAEDVGTAEAFPDYLNDLAFDADAGPTLEQANAMAEEDAAVRSEGAARPDPFSEAATPAPGIATGSPAQRLRKELAEEAAHVREDVEEAAVPTVTVPKKFQFKKPVAAAAEEGATEAITEEDGLEQYFSRKLKEADRRLFDYHKTHPSSKKYVSQCGSNLMRQPAVLSQEKYERMLEEYAPDVERGEVTFFLFPLDTDKKKDPYDPKPGSEYYTIMRYGTSERIQNYYLCCQYFCVRDEILVRKKDLVGTRLRRPVKQADGSMRETKEPNTCPFCEGKVVRNRRFPGVNETVIERIAKQGTTDSIHLHIRFLKKVYHPEGFYLPCCFLDDQPIRIGHPAYPEPSPAAYAAQAPARPIVAAEDELEAAAEPLEPEEALPTEKDLVSYEETLLKARFAYILGAEKLPLEGTEKKVQKVRKGTEELRAPAKISPPQIGILPGALNTYFAQDPSALRDSRTLTLKPNTQGFLRIGVENRKRYMNDSFLAAVAPFFRLNSVATFKGFLADVIQPRVFQGLNFGNLLLEFYDPSIKRPDREGIKDFAKRLGVSKVTEENKELVIRAYQSYENFQGWLASDATRKEYRQFAHLFSQPGLLPTGVRRDVETGAELHSYRRPGVLFIVIHMDKTGSIHVKCPPYPVGKEAFTRCDIGLLFHHWSGIWEPIVYVDTRGLSDRDLNTYFLLFSNSQFSRWPKVLQDRVQEFASQCASSTGGRAAYASQSGLHSSKLVGVSNLRKQLEANEELTLVGVVRDMYNHVGALLYQSTAIPGLVAVPAVDDGVGIVDTLARTVLDWDDYEPAPLQQVQAFYARYIEPRYPSLYAIARPVVRAGTEQIIAVQLVNGLYIPVGGIQKGVAVESAKLGPAREVKEMEWSINRAIFQERGIAEPRGPGVDALLRTKEFNEVFEHLRLTFSNWLNSEEAGAELRHTIEETAFRTDIPLIEKRKRLELLLGPIVESWITESDEDAPRQASLLRVDCRLRSEEECGGMCSWKQETGKCLLHVPKTSPLEDTAASAARVLLLRLIEELVRYANRRRQLFERRVSQIAILEKPIQQDDQLILPETSLAWSELLRLEWAKDQTEVPKFLEEMHREPAAGTAATAALPALDEQTALPATLKTLLGSDDPLVGRLRLYVSPSKDFTALLAILGVPTEAGTVDLTDELQRTILRKTTMSIAVYDLRVDPPVVTAKRLLRDRGVGYIGFVLRDEVPPALLVTNPEEPAPLQRSDLPAAFLKTIEASKPIFLKPEA